MNTALRSSRRVSWLATGLLAAGFLAGDSALAQGPPPPTKRGWSFYVSTEGSYESNPNFQSPPNVSSDFWGSGGGGFAYSHGSARGSVNLTGDARALFYRELTDLNTQTFGGTLAGNYRAGPKTEMVFNGSISSDYARRSQLLIEEGLVLGQVQVLTTRLNATISRVLSTRSNLSFTGRFEQAEFDSEVLFDGQTLGGSVSLGHRLKPTTSLSLTYSFDQTESDALRRQLHTVSTGVRIAMGERRDLNLSAGATSFPSDTDSRQIEPYGAATLNLRYQYLTLAFGLSHEVRQEYGLGRLRLSDVASVSLTRIFGARRTSFTSSLSYGQNRAPTASVEDFRYNTYSAAAGLKFPINRALHAEGGYSYFRSSQVDQPIDSHTVFVSLAYRFEPR